MITSSRLQAAKTAFKAIVNRKMGGYTPFHPKLAYQSRQGGVAKVVYGWLGSFPRMREFKGEADIKRLVSSDWEIKNKPFHNTIAVKEEDMERDQLGLYTPMFELMGEDAAQHPDFLLADLMLNGFTQVDYTGVAFFGSNKPHIPGLAGSTTFSNTSTQALDETSFDAGIATLDEMTDVDGRPINVAPDYTLVVGPSNRVTATKLVVSRTLDAGGDNPRAGTAKLEVWNFLGSSPKWFLFNNGGTFKPFVNQIEKDVEFNATTNPEDSHVLTYHEYLYQAYRRGEIGYGLPQLAYGSTGVD